MVRNMLSTKHIPWFEAINWDICMLNRSSTIDLNMSINKRFHIINMLHLKKKNKKKRSKKKTNVQNSEEEKKKFNKRSKNRF